MVRAYCVTRMILFLMVLGWICPGVSTGVLHAQQDKKPQEKSDPLPTLKNTSVSIPWQELRQLLDRGKAVVPQKPPVEFVFSPASYKVTIKDRMALISARVQVQTLTEQWTLVPLGPASNGVLSVTVDGKPASIVARQGSLLALVRGAGAKKIEMKLERDVSILRGIESFDVPLLPSPIVGVEVTIGKANLSVGASAGAALSVTEGNNQTKIKGTFRGESTAKFHWKPTVEEVQQETRVYAETNTLISVSSGLIRCESQIQYDVQLADVQAFRIHLPEGAQLVKVSGRTVKSSKVAMENQKRVVVVELDAPVRGRYELTLSYDVKSANEAGKTLVPVIGHPGALRDHGALAVEVRGSMELKVAVTGAERIDVKELPGQMWRRANSPLLYAFRYTTAPVSVALDVTKHQDLAVLVAMSDICEATTVVTEEGRAITKLMYIVRNNRKQYMQLKLPEGARIWSAFVDDRPVTPAKTAKGMVLIPLKKSDEVEDDDEDSYRARREQRREARHGEAQELREKVQQLREIGDEPARDLKPYDVEIVYIQDLKLEQRGELDLALPTSDIPTGHLAWAIFMPESKRVVDTEGNLKEVSRFALPFRHFGEAAYLEQKQLAQADEQLDQLKNAMEAALTEDQGEARAKAQGVLPVRVQVPIVGEIYRFEKFLLIEQGPSVKMIYRTVAS